MGVSARDRLNPPPAVRLVSAQLEVKLEDTNPFIALSDARLGSEEYNIHWRLFYQKKITFVKFPINEEARKTTAAASITIEGAE
jgi:hypothetical protein